MKIRKLKYSGSYVITLGKECISFTTEYWEASEPKVKLLITEKGFKELLKKGKKYEECPRYAAGGEASGNDKEK